ncbi:estradiol 17-beta-dehydrogenase 1 isoform X1 [Mirounga leonina]|uniref:estradiol 17-beta-dehydrogenase 1 isoform X1 n=1 Tax=Mirounga leonina TaxID=9715 RepID=UPI00156C4B8D|nr:estradiol 17-beta-dehydrogenase 1 isoform X1 [Mirounga leonina]XP_045744847.1 17-beta-hydroxysteroid dehydrogenase type 1 isoform X1 [Mirounga angustirostris]
MGRVGPRPEGGLSLEIRLETQQGVGTGQGRSRAGGNLAQRPEPCTPHTPLPMDRTVVLITGCSSGIGLHLALRLASDPSRSFKVYATLRDLRAQGPLWEAARARGCPPGFLETLQLDVRDADSVAAARARVTEGRVDVLVCNAGRGLLGPLEVHTAGAVGSVLDVNVAGTVRTLQAFLPDMKRRRSGRILVTGSMGGLMGAWNGAGPVGGAEPGGRATGCSGLLVGDPPRRASKASSPLEGLPFNAVYCASKFAIEGLCESLAVLLPPFGVHVSLIECGPVRTAFLEKQEGVPGGALDGADAETRVLFSRYQRHLERIFREAAQDPEEVTEVFLAALRAPRPALRYFSTESFLPLAHLRLADPSGCSYVAAMHRAVFADEPAEEETASDRGGPVLCAPPAAAAPQ